jgi:hypothetical protein
MLGPTADQSARRQVTTNGVTVMGFNQKALVTAPEVASQLKVSVKLINLWRRTGKLEAVGYRGRSPLYRLCDLQRVERETRNSPMNLKRA